MLLSIAVALAGEGAWRTLETEHFRVHHPVAATAYAEEAVKHLEEARDRTEAVVGRVEVRKVDVYVQDPFSTANGMAISTQRNPRMVLWTTPPEASSQLANYRDAFEDLIVHEDLHLVHLLMPARGGRDQVLQRLTGVGPVARKSPRWLAEGYATVVEGQLTGHGRPHGDFRSAFLRVLAEDGRLPSYGVLNGSSAWNGGSYAYLVGSAFLEWLVERTDPEALQRLWRRMSATASRDFDAAFAGVFGQRPRALYDRFRAETTAAALGIEAPAAPGTVFLDREDSLHQPAVSPNGKRLAVVVVEDGKRELQILATAVDEDAVDAREKALTEQLAEDPLDVASVASVDPPHEVIETLDRNAVHPRWIDDDTVLFHSWFRHGDRYRNDLVRYNLGDVLPPQRITHGADVRNADPAPMGGWAAAVQMDWGRTRIVRVGIPSGAIRPLTDWSVERVVDVPRVSPDGKRIVYLEAAPGRAFRPVVMQADGSDPVPVPLPAGIRVADPEWVDADTLAFGIGTEGRFEIVQHTLGTPEWTTLTDTGGRAVQPAIADDRLYYLRLSSDGYDVYETDRTGVRDRPLPARLATIHPPELPADVPPPTGEGDVPEARPYGIGRPLFRPILGGAWGTSGVLQGELGIRFGDATGRHEGFAAGLVGRRWDVLGAGAVWTWRAWPVDLTVHGSGLRALGQSGPVFGLRASAELLRSWGGASIATGGYGREVTGTLVPGVHGEADLHLSGRALGLGSRVRLNQLGTTGGHSREILPWVRLGRVDGGLRGSWRHGVRGAAMPYVLGGQPTSITLDELQWAYAGGMVWGTPITPGGATTLNDRRVELLAGPTTLSLQNVRLGNEDTRLEGTMVAVATGGRIAPRPILGLPALSVDLGVGCQLNVPEEEERRRRPCRSLSHYASWMSLAFHL